jgi:hypothetical protein
MTRRKHTKLVREGGFAAEVDIELIDSEDGWSPCLSLGDARKLDSVRKALRNGDLGSVSENARVFSPTPVEVDWVQ